MRDLIPPPSEPVLGSDAPDAITLGRFMDEEFGIAERIRYGGDQGVVLLGANGKGKGTRILAPNLLEMSNCSLFVTDPKGELAAITAPFRRSVGKVVVINPFGVLTDISGYEDLTSEGFNPLIGLDPDSRRFNSQVAQIADALVPIEGKDPHWSKSARSLVAALLMFVVIEAKYRRRVPTMRRFRELLCQPSEPPHKGNEFEGVGLPKLLSALAKAKHAGLANKAAQFAVWTDEIKSVVSTAQIQTEPFDDDEIADDMAKGGFDFGQLKREPVTVYVILPPDMMERHSRWLRLLLTRAIQSVLRRRAPGEFKTVFMLDEFYALGHLQIVSSAWALVRGYGIQMMPVLQDLNQLKELYPKNFETFLGMAGAVASFAPNDLTSAEWLSKHGGEASRLSYTLNETSGTGGNSGWSSNPNGSGSASGGSSWSSSKSFTTAAVRAPTISAHRLFGLSAGQMVMTLDGGSNLVPVYAPPYYDIRRRALVARDNPYYLA